MRLLEAIWCAATWIPSRHRSSDCCFFPPQLYRWDFPPSSSLAEERQTGHSKPHCCPNSPSAVALLCHQTIKKLQLSTLPARSGAALVSCPPLPPHNPSNEGLQLLKTLSHHALIIQNSTLRAVLNQPQPYKSRVRGAHMMSFCWFLFWLAQELNIFSCEVPA